MRAGGRFIGSVRLEGSDTLLSGEIANAAACAWARQLLSEPEFHLAVGFSLFCLSHRPGLVEELLRGNIVPVVGD